MNRHLILYGVESFLFNSIKLILRMIMKSKDYQKFILSKYESGDDPKNVFKVLNIIEAIKNYSNNSKHKKVQHWAKLAHDLSISRTNVQSMLIKHEIHHCPLISIKNKEFDLLIGYEQSSEHKT